MVSDCQKEDGAVKEVARKREGFWLVKFGGKIINSMSLMQGLSQAAVRAAADAWC